MKKNKMQQRSIKGLKPFIIKYVAMFMGICYLINPLQEQLHMLLHEISHAIESPTQIISHESHSEVEHRSIDHYETSVLVMEHDHGIVDFINTIFETSSKKNQSEESLLKEVKIDKHITTNQFQLQECFKINIEATYRMFQEKSTSGYSEKMKKPPQLLAG